MSGKPAGSLCAREQKVTRPKQKMKRKKKEKYQKRRVSVGILQHEIERIIDYHCSKFVTGHSSDAWKCPPPLFLRFLYFRHHRSPIMGRTAQVC